jgi:hypothetical protein
LARNKESKVDDEMKISETKKLYLRRRFWHTREKSFGGDVA